MAILYHTGNERTEHKLLFACYGVMLFMSLDGLLQWATGSNIFGYPSFSDRRIVGIFYPRPYLSLFLAIFSPVYYEAVRKLSVRYRWAWLSLFPLFAVILLGASRTAWMLSFFATLGYGYYYIRSQQQKSWRKLNGHDFIPLVIKGAMFVDGELKEAA